VGGGTAALVTQGDENAGASPHRGQTTSRNKRTDERNERNMRGQQAKAQSKAKQNEEEGRPVYLSHLPSSATCGIGARTLRRDLPEGLEDGDIA